MSKQYWHCDVCRGNFDHGESCDCKKHEPGAVFKVSETLVLGVDISKDDTACIQIVKVIGNTRKVVNTIYGEEARQTYDILMNRGAVVKV